MYNNKTIYVSTNKKSGYSKIATAINSVVAPAIISSMLILFSGQAMATEEPLELAPPPFSTIDERGVNVASGQVSHTLTDLQIGAGQLSLVHTIGLVNSSMVNWRQNYVGYQEKFRGGIYEAVYSQNGSEKRTEWTLVYRAFGPNGSLDFFINDDGTYTPVKDLRANLTFIDGVGFEVTKANGTKLTYPATANALGEVGTALSKIEYANGFVITIYRRNNSRRISDPIQSVFTNNGLQLKYFYKVETRIWDGVTAEEDTTSHKSLPRDGLDWSSFMPDNIKAINNTVEYCAPYDTQSITTNCQVQHEWPTVTYQWPDGMPRAMYTGYNVFSVTDAAGRITEYHHRGIDWGNENYEYGTGQYPLGNKFTPKVVGIKPTTSHTIDTWYSYKSEELLLSKPHAWVNGAISLEGSVKYGEHRLYGNEQTLYSSYLSPQRFWGRGGRNDDDTIMFSNVHKVITSIESTRKDYTFDDSFENRLTSVVNKFGGGSVSFKYDARGNVTERNQNGIITKAGYPITCTNPKTCNKPEWMSDAKGNKTHFTYHPESGQIATITSPPVSATDSKRTKTVYTYTQQYAYYKQNQYTSTLIQAPSPIWMRETETTCINSNHNGGGCDADDAVVKTYEYDNNLFLIGIAITADDKTVRTCTRYNKVGNPIRVTKPKAGLTSCQY